MHMVAGLLEQAQAGRVANDGRPTEVILHLRTGDKRISLRSNRLRPVAEPQLLHRLREAVGEENVRVISAKRATVSA